MDTRTGDIYPTQDAALKAGVPEDRIVTGTSEAITDLKRRLFPKPKRRRLRNRGRR